MRTFKILLTLSIVFNLSSCVDKDLNNKISKTNKDNLLKTIEEFNESFQEGNIGVLELMIAENYLHTNGNSKSIGKKDWFNYLSKREDEIKSGNLEVIDYGMEEMEIGLYENMAIVTGKIVVLNKEMGEIQKNEYRVTNVWINDHGNWKRAGFHDGKIK